MLNIFKVQAYKRIKIDSKKYSNSVLITKLLFFLFILIIPICYDNIFVIEKYKINAKYVVIGGKVTGDYNGGAYTPGNYDFLVENYNRNKLVILRSKNITHQSLKSCITNNCNNCTAEVTYNSTEHLLTWCNNHNITQAYKFSNLDTIQLEITIYDHNNIKEKRELTVNNILQNINTIGTNNNITDIAINFYYNQNYFGNSLTYTIKNSDTYKYASEELIDINQIDSKNQFLYNYNGYRITFNSYNIIKRINLSVFVVIIGINYIFFKFINFVFENIYYLFNRSEKQKIFNIKFIRLSLFSN